MKISNIKSFVRQVQRAIKEGDYKLTFVEAEGYDKLGAGGFATVYKINEDEVVRILDKNMFTFKTDIEDYKKLQKNPQSNVVDIHKVIPLGEDNDPFVVIMEYLEPIHDHYDIKEDGFEDYMYGYFGSSLIHTDGDYEKSLDMVIDKVWGHVDFVQRRMDDNKDKKTKEDVEKYIYRKSPVKDILYQI